MNQQQLINKLKNKKIYILSPHLDDAVLSCGMLMHNLKNKADITVVSVFTNAHSGPYTLSAKQFLKNSGYRNAVDLYSQRVKEDQEALKYLKVKSINLGFTDSLFRRKKKLTKLGRILPELDHLYPTYRWHILRSIVKSDKAISELIAKLKEIVSKGAFVFVPYGFGNHIDHKITRLASEAVLKDIIYYLDFPYSIRDKSSMHTISDFSKTALSVNLNLKSKLIHLYKSQADGLFPSGLVPIHQEIFYTNKS